MSFFSYLSFYYWSTWQHCRDCIFTNCIWYAPCIWSCLNCVRFFFFKYLLFCWTSHRYISSRVPSTSVSDMLGNLLYPCFLDRNPNFVIKVNLFIIRLTFSHALCAYSKNFSSSFFFGKLYDYLFFSLMYLSIEVPWLLGDVKT